MEVLKTVAQMRAWSAGERRAERRIAFVPTMGALHEGHLSLVKLAREAGDRVVVSIFVNPIQFDRPEDLAGYPRSDEADLELCRKHGVDAVFLPAVTEIYPGGHCTFVDVVGDLTDKLCAATRPGHFRGVCTVVTKLFGIVTPDVAVFGEKDLQQLLILSRMVHDLSLPVEIRHGPTVREADGLAMSSRNRRLSPADRRIALCLPRGLQAANEAFQAGERSSMRLIEALAEEVLCNEGVDLDYADVVSLSGFKEVETADADCVLAAAAFIGGIRLIDHIHLGGPGIAVADEG